MNINKENTACGLIANERHVILPDNLYVNNEPMEGLTMMHHQSLLAEYQQLLELSSLLLQHAQAGEWEKLIESEVKYVQTVASLTKVADLPPLPDVVQARLANMLRRTLDNEVEIKRLLQQRMDTLTALMAQSSTHKKMHVAYAKFS